MITHIVLLQPKPETTREELTHVFGMLKELQQHITGILDVQTGEMSAQTIKGILLALLCSLEREDLKAYAPHPAHRLVSDELVRVCSRIIDFDLE